MSLTQHQGLEAPHLPADLVLRRRHGGQLGVYGDDAVKRPFWRRPDHLRIDLRDHSGVGGGREEGKEREKGRVGQLWMQGLQCTTTHLV